MVEERADRQRDALERRQILDRLHTEAARRLWALRRVAKAVSGGAVVKAHGR